MKILFTGGGSGGHFYPIIAIIQELNDLVLQNKFLTPKYYYMSDSPYDEKALFEYNIEYKHVSAGKLRRYFSLKNYFGLVATGWGVLSALWKLFMIYPDVVVGKGGYASFPAILAARVLGIPVILHESDATPGRVTKFAASFANKIGIAHASAATHLPHGKTALVGIPIRRELRNVAVSREGGLELLKLSDQVPAILIVGGSQGAQAVNEVVLDILPELITRYQVIHQVGVSNVASLNSRLSTVLSAHPNKDRYKMSGFLGASALAMSAAVSSLVVSRAGSTFLFEIAGWGKPSIIIPIPESVSHDQHSNAFNYARAGAGVIIEEANLSPHILLSEIDRIMSSPDIQKDMSEKASTFSTPDAARKMAEAVLEIALAHEK